MSNSYIYQMDKSELKEYRKNIKSQIRQAKTNLKELNRPNKRGHKFQVPSNAYRKLENLETLLADIEKEIKIKN